MKGNVQKRICAPSAGISDHDLLFSKPAEVLEERLEGPCGVHAPGYRSGGSPSLMQTMGHVKQNRLYMLLAANVPGWLELRPCHQPHAVPSILSHASCLPCAWGRKRWLSEPVSMALHLVHWLQGILTFFMGSVLLPLPTGSWSRPSGLTHLQASDWRLSTSCFLETAVACWFCSPVDLCSARNRLLIAACIFHRL